jgi:mannose/fructose/N-acetylgalactosamine-specific phosphotransferase system component IID
MNNTLTQEQKDELRRSFKDPDFSAEDAIKKLMAHGFSHAVARGFILTEVRARKQELFEEAMKGKKVDEVRGFAFVAVVMVSLLSTLFGIHSIFWHVVITGIAGIAGFFAFQNKPIAGVLSFIVFAIIFPFAFDFYFSGRTSFIKIEMFIPMLMAAAPAAIFYYALSLTVYANTED